MESSGNWIVDNLNKALLTWNDALQDIIDLLTVSPENFRGGGVWDVIIGVNGALKAAALALLVLFFCMSIFKTTTNLVELKRPEVAVKMFIRFALAQAAINHCMDIMLALFGICQGILSTVAGSIGSMGDQAASLPAEIVQKITEVGFLNSIPLTIVTFLGSIMVTVLSFVMLFTIYGRFFRLFTYTAVAPIAISTFGGEATAHYGMTFIKSYAGVCLEGVIIVLACIIFSAFASAPPESIIGDATAVQAVWDYIVQLVFNMLILVGSIKMSERLTKEMLGL